MHRVIGLTPAGKRLATSTACAFEQIDETLAELAAEGLTTRPTTLTISAAPSFATKWLARRLHRFQGAQLRPQIRLVADETLSDPGKDRTLDVAVRYGAGPYSPLLVAERLWRQGAMAAVCAPALGSGLKEPRELLSLPLIRTAIPPRVLDGLATGWVAWFEAAGVNRIDVQPALEHAPLMGTSQLALEAAISGQGVALAPAILVVDDLRAGRLVQPFEVAVQDPFSFWLLYRRDRAEETKIRAFAKWIAAEAEGAREGFLQ